MKKIFMILNNTNNTNNNFRNFNHNINNNKVTSLRKNMLTRLLGSVSCGSCGK